MALITGATIMRSIPSFGALGASDRAAVWDRLRGMFEAVLAGR